MIPGYKKGTLPFDLTMGSRRVKREQEIECGDSSRGDIRPVNNKTEKLSANIKTALTSHRELHDRRLLLKQRFCNEELLNK